MKTALIFIILLTLLVLVNSAEAAGGRWQVDMQWYEGPLFMIAGIYIAVIVMTLCGMRWRKR
jgi:hypothetical protein